MNTLYKDDNFYFLDARQLTVDEACDNDSSVSKFDDILVCPGKNDPVLKALYTDFPSAAPSPAPSSSPSGVPTTSAGPTAMPTTASPTTLAPV
jgi:hypothetical protein